MPLARPDHELPASRRGRGPGAALAAAFLLVGCSGGPGAAAPEGILLITIDTLRADHLGCYGAPGDPTPRIDRLAAEGMTFADTTTPVPITLPSHASIFTGVAPPVHGVRDNGDYRLPADRTTLAEQLRDAGYATAAFVGAVVLDSAFGLDRGFDTYDDAIALPALDAGGGAASYPERPAARVVDAALRWIQAVPPERRFFAWVHLFDPHAPYAPPEPIRSRLGSTYAGEVAYVDQEVGRLLDGLARFGRGERSLVVLTADHGEGLGEHGETTHGFFLYQSTLHVPLLFRFPGRIPPGTRESAPVSTLDILPTVLDLTGRPVPPHLGGLSLGGAMRGIPPPPDRAFYVETYLPYFQMRWSGSRGVRVGRFKLIDAADPEQYDLEADPAERQNLGAGGDAPRLRQALETLSADLAAGASRPAASGLGAAEEARLRSLGYLAGGGGAGGAGLEAKAAARPSTRDRIHLVEALQHAAPAAIDQHDPAALQTLSALAAEDPENPRLLAILGKAQLEQGQPAAGIDSLRRASALDPDDAGLRASLAAALLRGGTPAEAAAAVARALAVTSGDPGVRRAQAMLLLDRGKAAEAEQAFRALLAERPADPQALRGLGRALGAQKRWPEAAVALESFLQVAPGAVEELVLAGTAAYRSGDPERAAARFEAALARSPANPGALLGLGILLGERGDDAAAAAMLGRAARAAPSQPGVLTAYGIAAARAGSREEARRALERSLALDPKQPLAREALRALAG